MKALKQLWNWLRSRFHRLPKEDQPIQPNIRSLNDTLRVPREWGPAPMTQQDWDYLKRQYGPYWHMAELFPGRRNRDAKARA